MKIILLLSLLFCWACSKESLDKDTEVLEQGIADENSEGVKVSEYVNNRLDYIIEAKSMERFTDRRMLYGYFVTLSSYDQAGMLSSVIKADTAIVDDARNVIFANGNVSFKTQEGEIKGEKMFWDRNLDEITVPTYVTLTRNGDVLTGQSLRTNTKLSYAEMDAVKAEGYFDEEDFLDW
ncbi:MAG: LPS export ABC transporter periplasmic protein LptC [Candidatus Cloacimonetes bacterium]|nr:LPS export ABC transporter periplasmic protein LptC [Candidatus Cloacimonadota bacterium]MCK9331698.1 LPS export ABC transporter periplasmic protein LptC [Candidatus Cloacimonadota bacterium]MDD3283089.1 LPS export ABC transporter periplasmic protein LptC [Candidatus Cloacimonadota bacterium]MDD4231311.1 LPS export ABC transporter periplasmic protein LptC [Candidatus Cloacimonadota bacterium]MDY0298238.1 LPS export ABC transporter periplasmic protein LptC [Candidatus Cloacimonadaceae bacteri